jgi:ketosteroid isomerase-like protein
MKLKYSPVFAAQVVMICGLFTARVAAALPPDPSSEIKTFLQQYRDNFARGMREGEPLLMKARGSENTRLLTEAQPTVFGPENITAYHRAFLARFAVRAYVREATGQFDLGARVIETGRFTERLTLKNSGETFELVGKYLELWEKLPDGNLQQVVSADNFDSSFAGTDLLRFSEVPSIRTAFQARSLLTSDTALEIAGDCLLLQRAVIEHDAALWGRLYSEDAMLLTNNSTPHRGRKSIDEYLVAHCQELPIFEKLDIRNDRIEESYGYVFEYASHVASWRSGDSSGVSTGKNLRIWRRESAQTLKLIFQIGSYD